MGDRIKRSWIVRRPARDQGTGIDRDHTRPTALLAPGHLDRSIAQHRRVDRQREIKPGQVELARHRRQETLGQVARVTAGGIVSGRQRRERDRPWEDITRRLPDQGPRVIQDKPRFAAPGPLRPLRPVVKAER